MSTGAIRQFASPEAAFAALRQANEGLERVAAKAVASLQSVPHANSDQYGKGAPRADRSDSVARLDNLKRSTAAVTAGISALLNMPLSTAVAEAGGAAAFDQKVSILVGQISLMAATLAITGAQAEATAKLPRLEQLLASAPRVDPKLLETVTPENLVAANARLIETMEELRVASAAGAARRAELVTQSIPTTARG